MTWRCELCPEHGRARSELLAVADWWAHFYMEHLGELCEDEQLEG